MASYSTKATSKGGRAGRSGIDGGKLALAMSFPKELGGDDFYRSDAEFIAIGQPRLVDILPGGVVGFGEAAVVAQKAGRFGHLRLAAAHKECEPRRESGKQDFVDLTHGSSD